LVGVPFCQRRAPRSRKSNQRQGTQSCRDEAAAVAAPLNSFQLIRKDPLGSATSVTRLYCMFQHVSGAQRVASIYFFVHTQTIVSALLFWVPFPPPPLPNLVMLPLNFIKRMLMATNSVTKEAPENTGVSSITQTVRPFRPYQKQ
jgi:hypothetical protein